MRNLLDISNAKTSKSTAYGYLTGILYLAPAKSAGITLNGVVISLCTFSGNCVKPCLGPGSGHGRFEKTKAARIRKTRELFADKAAFMERLRWSIRALIRKAARLGLKPAVRVNGTSDLFRLVKPLLDEFPEVQFYDYTKVPRPWLRERKNYHLTFSFDGETTLNNNWKDSLDALQHGFNLAVAFDVKPGTKKRPGGPLPSTWRGFEVLDGDKHDLRFLDGHQGKIIGLRAKGIAQHEEFRNQFVQIAAAPTN